MRTFNRTLAASTTLTVVLASVAVGQPGKMDDPAVTAARVRQERIKTAAIEFKVTEVYSKGSVSEGNPVIKKGSIAPPDETTLESTNRFVIDGTKTRYEGNHFLWHRDREKFVKDANVYGRWRYRKTFKAQTAWLRISRSSTADCETTIRLPCSLRP